MKKKTLLLLPITLLCAASLTACGDSDVIESPSKGSTSEVKPDTPSDETTTHTHIYDEWTIVKAATETTKGSQKRICIVCGYEETKEIDVLPHTHTYSKEWSNDETNHWHQDTCGHDTKIDEEEHTYGEWTVITEATETTKGSQKRVCSVCGYEEIKEIEILPHTHKYSTNWSSDETSHWHSDTCGHDTKRNEEEHSYGEWTTTVEPTISTEGEKCRTCSVCGYEDTQSIEKITYTVTWLNYDETVLETDIITEAGVMPSYDGATPSKPAYEKYEYEFIGWDKELGVVTSDITYKAEYDKTLVFEYTTNEDNTLTITKYNGTKNEVVVPSTIDGKIVTCIGDKAFYFCRNVTSVTIPESITSIGEDAFSNCWSLTSITIPNGVSSIGSYTFNKCRSLISITIPNGVTSIENSTFDGCSSLTSITIPDGVTTIGRSAFDGCSSLTSITIPDGVTSIGGSAFDGCSSLTSIIIPDGVTKIEYYMFYKCSSLTSITIPNGVTTIESKAFYSCNKLEYLYYNGTIDDWLNIEFENEYANPNSNLYCDYFYLLDDNGIIENDNHKYSLLTEVIIPNGITSIKNYAFYGCDSIKNIIISDSVTSIGDNAFYSCHYLGSITIPGSITNIGECAFVWCSNLRTIYYNGKIEDWIKIEGSRPNDFSNSIYFYILDNNGTIENNGNMYNLLTDVIIPDNITSIGVNAFRSFNYLTSVKIPNNVTSIGYSAFSGCYNLTSITIPDSVTCIGEYAFFNCSSLASLIIPNSVTNIGDNAFSDCESFTSITLPASITSIGKFVFSGCDNLTSITIPDSVTSIENGAFCGCDNLSNIIISNNVTSIGEYAFSDCSVLNTVYIKGTIEEWNNINIDSTNTELMEATKYFYSESKPTDTTYNYWHYVDGEPSAW